MELVDYTNPEDLHAYRVKVTVRNNLLLTAIEESGYKSVSEFSREIGYHSTRVGDLVALREAPIKKDGSFSHMAKKIMEVLGAAPSDLWTPEQLNMRLQKNSFEDKYTTDTVQAILGSNVVRLEGAVYKDAEKPEQQLDKKELKSMLEKGLAKLTSKQKKVLILIFGLDDGKEHSLEETAEIMSVTTQRVRQIKAVALNKMRRPSTIKSLKDHAEELLGVPDKHFSHEWEGNQ
jgi:RNA polymerase sigma factor (sigma-70 family)